MNRGAVTYALMMLIILALAGPSFSAPPRLWYVFTFEGQGTGPKACCVSFLVPLVRPTIRFSMHVPQTACTVFRPQSEGCHQ